MRIFIVALGVLCLALPGIASTSTTISPATPIEYVSQEISAELLGSIFRYLQQHYDYNYECLCDQYKQGEISVEVTSQGYLVSIMTTEGGMETILIIADI